MAVVLNLTLENEEATRQFSQQLAHCCKALNQAVVIYLEGDLGTGKTTIARGFIQTFGFNRVKSPTYSLVESYQNNQVNIHHFDCYRLHDAKELDYIGIRDYLGANHIFLIEWAQLGQGAIAKADMTIELSGGNDHRALSISSHTQTGKQLLNCIEKLRITS